MLLYALSVLSPSLAVAPGWQPHTSPPLPPAPAALRATSTAPLTSSGAGPIGLVTLLAAHAAGCYPIVITDLFESRLKFAETLVPTVKTLVIPRGAAPEDVAGQIKAKAGMELRVALECTGVESSIRTAIYVSANSRSRGLTTSRCSSGVRCSSLVSGRRSRA